MSGSGPDAIPKSPEGVESLLDDVFTSPRGTFASALISPDYQRANVQVTMNSGDNKSMQEVLDAADAFFAERPFPPGVTVEWAG